jgi:hypothetical protein
MKEVVQVFAKSIKEQTNKSADGQEIWGSLGTIIQGILGVLGIVAVVFIIIGGINYATSQGDTGKVKKARDTILYAVIGLLVALFSFAIVTFILNGIQGK